MSIPWWRCATTRPRQQTGQASASTRAFPLRLERGPMEFAPGARIPVIGIRNRAFLAMEVGVNGHAVTRFELVHQGMGTSPITFCVPPQGGHRRRQIGRRRVCSESRAECVYVHAHSFITSRVAFGQQKQILRAPSFRLLSGERVGDHKAKYGLRLPINGR